MALYIRMPAKPWEHFLSVRMLLRIESQETAQEKAKGKTEEAEEKSNRPRLGGQRRRLAKVGRTWRRPRDAYTPERLW